MSFSYTTEHLPSRLRKALPLATELKQFCHANARVPRDLELVDESESDLPCHGRQKPQRILDIRAQVTLTIAYIMLISEVVQTDTNGF